MSDSSQDDPAIPEASGPRVSSEPAPTGHPLDVTPGPSSAPAGERPRFLFFGIVAAITLLLDISSKAWAEVVLTARPAHEPSILLLQNHLTLTLAYNKGGAWGLLQDSSELVRLPFFLAVSVLAVMFIVSLYGKLAAGQTALKWGLPLVLGGDCSILLGTTLALRRRGRFGLLFIDGHADFYQPEVEPKGEAASMDLAFATGPHQCVGMNVARLEGRIAIGRFLARFPEFALAAPPARAGRARFRGFAAIPARLA